MTSGWRRGVFGTCLDGVASRGVAVCWRLLAVDTRISIVAWPAFAQPLLHLCMCAARVHDATPFTLCAHDACAGVFAITRSACTLEAVHRAYVAHTSGVSVVTWRARKRKEQRGEEGRVERGRGRGRGRGGGGGASSVRHQPILAGQTVSELLEPGRVGRTAVLHAIQAPLPSRTVVAGGTVRGEDIACRADALLHALGASANRFCIPRAFTACPVANRILVRDLQALLAFSIPVSEVSPVAFTILQQHRQSEYWTSCMVSEQHIGAAKG
eukprot:492841-Rhodomonas_salina.2